MQVPEGYILITQEEYNLLKESIRVLSEDNRVLSEKLVKLSKTSQNSSKPPAIPDLQSTTYKSIT